jgi:hypothetical protein
MNNLEKFAMYQEAAKQRKIAEANKRKQLRVMFWFIETYEGKFWATNHSSMQLSYGFPSYKAASAFIQKEMAAITL